MVTSGVGIRWTSLWRRCAQDDSSFRRRGSALEADVGLEEGVGIAFFADGGGGAVAGDNDGRVGEGEEAVVEGAEDLAAVAAREVGATDGAGEECVAREEQIFGHEVEADTALGVAWSVEDAGGVAGDADDHAFVGAAIGRNDDGRWDTEPGGLIGHEIELGQVVLVEEDGGAGGFFEEGRAADVVDVAVGDDDLLQREVVGLEEGKDLRDIVAGIDDHGFAGGVVTEDGAVALERADGEGLEDHGSIVGEYGSRARMLVRAVS